MGELNQAAQDSKHNRGVIIGGSVIALIFVGGGLGLNRLFDGISSNETGSPPRAEAPLEPVATGQPQTKPSAIVAGSPAAQKTLGQGGRQIPLGQARQRTENAMLASGFEPLGQRRSGQFTPATEQQLKDDLAEARAFYGPKHKVPPAVAGVAINCSRLIRMGSGDEVSEATLQQVEQGLATGKYAVAAQGCENAVLEAWHSGITFQRLEGE